MGCYSKIDKFTYDRTPKTQYFISFIHATDLCSVTMFPLGAVLVSQISAGIFHFLLFGVLVFALYFSPIRSKDNV